MLKDASILLVLAAAAVSDAFLAPTPARAATTTMMAGKATVDSLKRVVLNDETTGHSAVVHLHGGCVTSYKAPHEVLGVRKDAVFDGSKPIAAGLQVCWPLFGPGFQQHGFARNLAWEVAAQSATEPEVTLVLKDSAETRKLWDHAFELHLTVRLEADHMFTRLTAKNTGKTPWDFTGAFHSYYSVSDVSKVTLQGKDLAGKTFVDKTQDPFVSTPLPASEMGITTFLEGVIPNYAGPMSISDKGHRTRTTVEHVKGWPDYILWAPLGNDGMGYKSFVCVETGAVSAPITVAGGASWVGEMKISSRQG